MDKFPRRTFSKPMQDNPLIDVEPVGTDIDRRVPPKIMRLTQHLHNLIYIRYFYETIGQQPPVWVKAEMQRAETALLDELESEQGQGGLLHGGKHETRKS